MKAQQGKLSNVREIRMRTSRGAIRLLARCIAAGFLCLWIAPLQAADRSGAFLDGLRKREFYDIALDYLESMRTSPLADKAFREIIDYETGVTLIGAAQRLPLKDRERQLDEARSQFLMFIAEHPEHPLVTSAQARLADLLMERARSRMELAGQANRTPEEKGQLLTQARALFQEAQEMLVKVDAQLKEKRKDYKNVDPNDLQRVAERDQILMDIMQARLANVTMVYDIARTYDPDSKENKESLEAAAVKLGEFFKSYSRYVGGWYARIDEARCYKTLGNYDKAYEILREIMIQREDEDSLRRMRTAATVVALQIMLLPQRKQYKEAVDIYRDWEQATAREGDSNAEALSVKYLAAEAALEYARGLNPDDSRQADTRKECLQIARNLLPFVARFPGEYRQKARIKMADPLLGGSDMTVDIPKNYNEARDRGKLAWERLQEPDVEAEESTQLCAEALQNFRFALAHVPPHTKTEDVNTIRYCLAYLHWMRGEHYDAAVMGEFLARRYPDRLEAQQGAEIALAAWAKLFGDVPPGEDRKFEDDRMKGISQFITDHWPSVPVADKAWVMLIRAAISKQEYGKAVEYLGQLDPHSPRRGDADLMTGQSLWSAYQDQARLPSKERLPKEELTKLLSQAQTALSDGIGRLRKPVDGGAEVPVPLVAASLSLAQICLDMGQAEDAIKWLDDPKIGAHTLTAAAAPATDGGNFRVETLKVTLRAYVAAQQLDRAEDTMNLLEKISGGENLTRIYFSLGKQLEESLKRIRDKGSEEDATVVARGFTAFLTRLSTRPRKETTFNMLSWVAEMFMTLGGKLDPGNGKLPAEAADYYKKAADTYRIIIQACRADANYGPQPTSIYSAQIRLARCLRQMRKYGQDMDVLLEILKVQNNVIEAQREAALTYQKWAEDNPEFYISAIRGGRKDESGGYVVWGWSRIARRVQGKPNLENLFHEARYNLALCRFKYAMSKSGQEQNELLEQAKSDITVVETLYPQMGGQQWRDQYDALLKKIQKGLSLPEDGLKALQKKASMNNKKAGRSEAFACAT